MENEDPAGPVEGSLTPQSTATENQFGSSEQPATPIPPVNIVISFQQSSFAPFDETFLSFKTYSPWKSVHRCAVSWKTLLNAVTRIYGS